MADINTVISGIVEVQNKTILSLKHNSGQVSTVSANIDTLSGNLFELSKNIPELYYNKFEVDQKVEDIASAGDSNLIESISVNGIDLPIVEKNIDIPLIKIDSLLFRIPMISDSEICHFKIEFSSSDEFNLNDIGITIKTNEAGKFELNDDNETIKNIRIFTGINMDNMSINGIQPVFSNEQMMLNINETYLAYPFFRFQWILTDVNTNETVNGKYVFGKISAIQTILDGGISYTKNEIDLMMNDIYQMLGKMKSN